MNSAIELTCMDCGETFPYVDAEREFRDTHGLGNPERCPDCRMKDRARRNGELITLYQRTESFDPFLLGENTQAGRGGKTVSRETRAFHRATCAACGAETRVPFVPRGDRPVYCKSCFNERRGR